LEKFLRSEILKFQAQLFLQVSLDALNSLIIEPVWAIEEVFRCVCQWTCDQLVYHLSSYRAGEEDVPKQGDYMVANSVCNVAASTTMALSVGDPVLLRGVRIVLAALTRPCDAVCSGGAAFAVGVTMTIEVGGSFGVVVDHGVQIQRLRISEIGVGDGEGGPVGAEPTAEAVGVVAGAEVGNWGGGVAEMGWREGGEVCEGRAKNMAEISSRVIDCQ
jgi:hypothetical protein